MIATALNSLAFFFVGTRGFLGRWAAERVRTVWCRLPNEESS